MKDEMNIIKDGMERSINEKMDLTKRLAEVLLENDRIKREQARYRQENEGKCIIS
jgi:predicted metal-binding transcription factor (methanogenesis marker protein 9)